MQLIYVTIRPLNREDSVLYFPPEAFGPFRVLHQIGAGTLGPVFRALRAGHAVGSWRSKCFVSISRPNNRRRWCASSTQLVEETSRHPNIAAPIAAGLEEGGTAYLAQEYAVGESLDVVLAEPGPLSIEDALAARRCSCRRHRSRGRTGRSSRLLHPRDILFSVGWRARHRLRHRGRAVGRRRTGADEAAVFPPDGPSGYLLARRDRVRSITGKRVSARNLEIRAAARVESGDAMGRRVGRIRRLRPSGPGARMRSASRRCERMRRLRPARVPLACRPLRHWCGRQIRIGVRPSSQPDSIRAIPQSAGHSGRRRRTPILDRPTEIEPAERRSFCVGSRAVNDNVRSAEPCRAAAAVRPGILLVVLAAVAALAFYLLRSSDATSPHARPASTRRRSTCRRDHQAPRRRHQSTNPRHRRPCATSPSLPAPTPSRRASGAMRPRAASGHDRKFAGSIDAGECRRRGERTRARKNSAGACAIWRSDRIPFV